MSLRRKIMLILLLTAVLPMLAVRAIQTISIYRLQTSVASDMRESLTDEAKNDMRRTVDGYAQSLEQETNFVYALLNVQAGEAERRLVNPAPASHRRVPTVREFELLSGQNPAANQVVLSEQHAVVNDDGRFEPLAVSYGTQVVRPDPGQPITAISRADIAKLADMTDVYQRIYEQAQDVILWQYTSLESGMHFSYPGKSGFPDDYRPRDRGWYAEAIRQNRPIATPPFVDASTRQLIITFAQPVRDRLGKPLGVTAIDLPVTRVLDPMELNTEWADQAKVVVVASFLPGPPQAAEQGVDPVSDKPNVYVVVDVDQRREGLLNQRDAETIHFDDPADREAVTQDLLAARNNVRRVSIDGEDRMIAYGRIDGRNNERPIFALIITPTQTILEPAEATIAQVEKDLHASLVNTGGILLGLLAIVGVVAFALSFRLTRPVVEMANASRQVASGDLGVRVKVTRRDELGQLAEAFNDMVPALQDRMKMRESLHVAMQVQQSLLPNAAPHVPGLDIAGHSEYCDETGGDYYDFIQLDQLGPDTLAIAVGDVTGHGIAAALLMATGRALIRSHANTTGSLGEVFTAVNRQLCDSEFTGRFMTLMYLIVQNHCNDQGCVPIRYLSAGHDPVVVYRPGEDKFIELAGHDIPLGIDADWTYHEQTSDALRPGDVLVVGTDGIWECFNDKDEQFGKDRMRNTIQQAAAGDSESIAQAISQACKDWRGKREQNDDITLVVVKLVG